MLYITDIGFLLPTTLSNGGGRGAEFFSMRTSNLVGC